MASKSGEKRTLTRRAAIGLSLAIALCAFAAALIALCLALPPQDEPGPDGKDYGYVYSGVKSSSVAFSCATMVDDAMVLFGSSELSTPPSLVSYVPAVVFGQKACGLDLAYVGEAYDQSLWQAIAAGAYANQLENRKVALIVSPSWFFDGGLDNSLFQTRFSYSLYRGFMDNPNLSEETRDYVCSRLLAQGIESSVVSAGGRDNALAAVNDAAYSFMDDLKLRSDLRALREKGFAHPVGGNEVPPFDTLRKRSLSEAQEKSTNNPWGFDNAAYDENVGDNLDSIKGKLAGETMTNTPEYDDFGLFLRVCRESGLEPLVIVAPLSGEYYDWVGIDAETRRGAYDHILTIANAYGARIADFSDREYEMYFLHDMVHFGWTGWVDVEQALYEFAMGD